MNNFKSPQYSDKSADTDIVFGIHPIKEAILADKEIERVLVQKDLNNPDISELLRLCVARKIPFTVVPPERLNRITRKNHQGVIAFVASVMYASLDHVITQVFAEGKNPLILVLDHITDVRNFGAIVRTAECAGVHAIVIPDRGAARLGSDAYKTSAGALSIVPICREQNLYQALRYLQNSGLQIVACTEKCEDEMYKADLTVPMAILMGSEEDGIHKDHLKIADHIVKIPMFGKIGSLNVSVASAVLLYEAVRQRK
jgi:23S rRNA (guanosine2251-2'-O)-methyltransferase